jgi:hypothetical protein
MLARNAAPEIKVQTKAKFEEFCGFRRALVR